MQYRVAFIWFFIVTVSLAVVGCRKRSSPPAENVIARIGSRQITLDDLKFRAELTIRPSPIKTPTAVLNNMIAEKLFAMEAGDTSMLARNPVFQAHIQGIREQLMRELLYKETALKSIKLDAEEIQKTYDLSQRVYGLEFFTINKPEITQEVNYQLLTGQMSDREIFENLKLKGKPGIQTIKWRDPENDSIHQALYSEALKLGDIIGPVRVGQSQWIMMQVLDVKIQPVIGPEDTQMRMDEVRQKMTDMKAKIIWQQYKENLMTGKEMRFEKDVFQKIIEWYIARESADQPDRLPMHPETADSQLIGKTPAQLDLILDRPFFRLDGETWTVGDFKRAIMSHPLVYRHKNNPNLPFSEQLKEAIADLIVDHYLNKEAYKLGLDKESAVEQKGQMWADSYIAKEHLNQYLKKIDIASLQAKDYSYMGTRAVDEYLVELNKKYRSDITVNMQLLKDFKLIPVPLLAYQQGMPFPMAVPGFPHFTNTDTLLVGN